MIADRWLKLKSQLPNLTIAGLLAIEISIAMVSGWGLAMLGVKGGAWILGGIVGGAIAFGLYRTHWYHQAKPNRNARKAGQILIGLTIGFTVQSSHFTELSSSLPAFGFLALCLVFFGTVIGYLYYHLESTDLLTAWLATVPGNIGVMASLAADYGRNTALVSLVQLLRFTAIILVVPLFAPIPVSAAHANVWASFELESDSFSWQFLSLLSLVLLTAVFAARLGDRYKVPVAAFICAIAVGIGFNPLLTSLPLMSGTNFHFPSLLTLLGQILLGITIGEYWGTRPKLNRASLGAAIVPVCLTFLAGLICASIAKLITPWDWLTCILVTAPGGSPEMIWIALALHQHVEIVTVGHLVRLILINSSLPFLVSLAVYLEQRWGQQNSPLMVAEYKAPD